MSRSLTVILTFLAALASWGATPATSAELNVIGTRVLDVNGQIHQLGMNESLAPVAIVFLDTGCPIANRYSPEMNQFHELAKSNGVELYGMLSDPLLTLKEAQAFQQKYKLEFPLIWDANGDLAMRLKPTHFPECFVIGKDDKLVYRGRIDNRFAAVGKLRQNITSHELRDAIVAISKGIKPATNYAPPIGCVFESWSDELPEKLTFNRHIAPIIYANCTTCHREGEVAPFPLENFAQTQRRAEMCASVCDDRLMPPWQAEPGFGHFLQERFLSNRQIDLIKAWAEGDQNEGVDDNRLIPPKFPKSGWALGKPDLELKMPQPFSVPATGKDIYRYFVISNPLDRDLLLNAMDFKPGDKTVVHHMNSFVDFAGRARAMDAKDVEPGFSVFGTGSFMSYDGDSASGSVALGGWVPGMGPVKTPKGHGIYIPKGGEVVIEIHYHLSGVATTDQSTLGLYFAKTPVDKYIDGTVIGTQDLKIEPGDKNYRRHFWMNIPADIDLIDVLPHMHYIGKSAKVEATLPDGNKVPLVNITNWDFRWQSLYTFREPIRLPKGSRIDAWFSFDNSKENFANPLPKPVQVGWGWETGDEMAEVWLAYVPVNRAQADKIYSEANKSWFRSGDPAAQSIDIKKTLKRLQTESLWTNQGEVLLTELYSSEELPDLIRSLDTTIRKNPQDANLFVAKGALLSIQTMTAVDETKINQLAMQADAALDSAIKIDPNHWDAWMTKAVFYAGGQEDAYEREALKMFKQLVDGQEQFHQPEYYAKAYREYGKLLAKRGNAEKANQVWRRGLRFHKENAELKELIE